MIQIGGRTYELVHERKNAWNPEAFKERYSDVLDRYDYIIGDWGYDKLRLKGFFRENHPKASKDTAFSFMSDYINEYCNFGCAYFVLRKIPNPKRQSEPQHEDGARPESAGAPGAARGENAGAPGAARGETAGAPGAAR